MRRLILVIVGLWIFNLGYEQDGEGTSKRIDSLPVFATPIPNNNLSDNLVWKRVSEYRYECEFLRFAVEYKSNAYALYELDEPKRLLVKSESYKDITREIVKLTININPRLNWIMVLI